MALVEIQLLLLLLLEGETVTVAAVAGRALSRQCCVGALAPLAWQQTVACRDEVRVSSLVAGR